MDGWTDRWMDEWIVQWMDGLARDEWMDRPKDGGDIRLAKDTYSSCIEF